MKIVFRDKNTKEVLWSTSHLSVPNTGDTVNIIMAGTKEETLYLITSVQYNLILGNSVDMYNRLRDVEVTLTKL